MFPMRPVWAGPRQSRRYQADRVGRTFSSGPQPMADKPKLLICRCAQTSRSRCFGLISISHRAKSLLAREVSFVVRVT